MKSLVKTVKIIDVGKIFLVFLELQVFSSLIYIFSFETS